MHHWGCDQVILLAGEMVVRVAGPQDCLGALEWSKEHQVLAGVVVDAFAKAGMKSSMDGVDPVVEYETPTRLMSWASAAMNGSTC